MYVYVFVRYLPEYIYVYKCNSMCLYEYMYECIIYAYKCTYMFVCDSMRVCMC